MRARVPSRGGRADRGAAVWHRGAADLRCANVREKGAPVIELAGSASKRGIRAARLRNGTGFGAWGPTRTPNREISDLRCRPSTCR